MIQTFSETKSVGSSYKWWTLVAVCFGLFMALLDLTVVTVALPVIANDFNTGLSDLQWVMNAYTIALGVLLVTSARLGDVFGRKKLFIIGLAVFSFGSLFCALSGNLKLAGWSHIDILNFSRVVQGIGSSAMIPLSLAIITDTFPAKQRGIAIGIWGGVMGFATAIGPVFGGILIAKMGWPSIFYLNIPIGVIGISMAVWAIRESRDERASRSIDIFGLTTLTIFTFCLILALIQGNDKGWGSIYILGLFLVSVISFVIFVFGELKIKQPMVDPKLFRNASFTGAVICGFTLNAGLYALFFYLSLYFENFLSFSALETGLRILPLSGLVLFAAPLGGWLTDRMGGRFILFSSMTMMTVGVLLMTVISPSDQQADWIILLPALILAGLGSGLANPPISTIAMGTIDPRRSGMASGIKNICDQIGMSFGIAFLGAFMAFRYNLYIKSQIEALHTSQLTESIKHQIIEMVQKSGPVMGSTGLRGDSVRLIPFHDSSFFPAIQRAVTKAFIGGITDILYWGAGILALGALASIILIRKSDMFHEKEKEKISTPKKAGSGSMDLDKP